MKIIFIALLIFSLSCHEKNPLTKEVLVVANENKFPYSDVLMKAKQGDEHSIEIMIQFYEKTDSASAFSHSVYIHEILKSVGEEKFHKILYKQNSKLIKWTLDWLQDRDHNIYLSYPKLKKLKS